MSARSPRGGWAGVVVLLVVLLVLGLVLRARGCHYNVHFADRIVCNSDATAAVFREGADAAA